MRAPRLVAVVLATLVGPASAAAQSKSRQVVRVKIDSQPEQAAVYIDSREQGIKGYTPTTLQLPKGTYTVLLELPGFRPVQKQVTVTRSQGFMFTLERQTRSAVIEVKSSRNNDSASGGQLSVDGTAVGTVPAKVEVQPGRHLVEIKKPGFADYREQVDVGDGGLGTVVAELQPLAKKGSLLVSADIAGADIYVDGAQKDVTPAMIPDLTEGVHLVEVRKDALPPWKQQVTVAAGKQTKVQAQLEPRAPPPPPPAENGSLRVISQTPGAEVYVDGEPKGAANAEITGLRPGSHRIELRAPGHQAQTLEQKVVAGEQRVVQLDLQPERRDKARLQVSSAVEGAEVFLDGLSLGKAPIDRSDLALGKHVVVVKKSGYAEWQREVNLDAASPTVLAAELTPAGSLKVLSNVSGAEVLLDGAQVGKTPLDLGSVPAGEHLVQVQKAGYAEAKQQVKVAGGEQKVLSADLVPQSVGSSPVELKRRRQMTSFSAVTLDPGRFTADFAVGFLPFATLRLSAGALRIGSFGLDGGVDLRTTGYFTDGGVHGKLQFVRYNPVAAAVELFIGGGGGPRKRNDFTLEVGLPVSLLFGELVRVTFRPHLQIYTDRNCPSLQDIKDDDAENGQQSAGGMPVPGSGPLYQDEETTCKANDRNTGYKVPTQTVFKKFGQSDPRARFSGVRLMLEAIVEFAVSEQVNLFVLIEGDPIGERQAYTSKFSAAFGDHDSQFYFQLGLSFKF